jgi:GNAT superfamily N-acetyltransferase
MKTFEEFLAEANQPKPDAIKTISKNWERRPNYRGVNVYATQDKDHIRVHDLFVPSHLRSKGVGGRVMKGVTKLADKHGAKVSLNPAPAPGYKKKLDTFYKNFGFKPNKGRNKDFTTKDTHIRQPKDK